MTAASTSPGTPNIRMLPVGDAAVLVELADLAQTLALFDAVGREPLPGVNELVPAARTLLVRFDPRATSIENLTTEIARRMSVATAEGSDADVTTSTPHPDLIEIPVLYDGEDLAEVAHVTGLTPAEVIRRHGERDFTVAFTGFAPGFAYLVGGDPSLRVPRRATARTSIPAGSVGLAGEFSGIYPRRSPGGWQLIGRTTAAMWDERRDEPALLRPGMRVRFVEVDAAEHAAAVSPASAPSTISTPTTNRPTPPHSAIEILDAGLLLTVQDDGRPGNAIRGVSPSGAMDHASLHRANREAGNRPGAAAFELAGATIILRALAPLTLATSGSIGAVSVTRENREERDEQEERTERTVAPGTAFAADRGDEIRVTPDAAAGVYGYLALRGGLGGSPVLGSVATDTLSTLGSPRPRVGDRFELGDDAIGPTDSESAPPLPPAGSGSVTDIPIVLGPREDSFTPAGVSALLDQDWQVTARSDRIGIRLLGAIALERTSPEELQSEGTIAGAIQVPLDGQPVVFMADHPVTGGYPVIAVVRRDALDTIAQIPAGARIRFRITPSAVPRAQPATAPTPSRARRASVDRA